MVCSIRFPVPLFCLLHQAWPVNILVGKCKAGFVPALSRNSSLRLQKTWLGSSVLSVLPIEGFVFCFRILLWRIDNRFWRYLSVTLIAVLFPLGFLWIFQGLFRPVGLKLP